jgi:4-carboxymuconolactone decarboxylase
MTRLPWLTRDQLDESTARLWDKLASEKGQPLLTADGLGGPYNAWLAAPDLGLLLRDLGTTLRSGTSLDRRLEETAILTVVAFYRAEYAFWAHARMARRHGVADDVVDAIRIGAAPSSAPDDERLAHAVARQLVTSGTVDEETLAPVRDLLGERGAVELVVLCGFYSLVSFTLNAFDVPLPPGASPAWE